MSDTALKAGEKTSDYYRTHNLPERFNQPGKNAFFRGFRNDRPFSVILWSDRPFVCFIQLQKILVIQFSRLKGRSPRKTAAKVE